MCALVRRLCPQLSRPRGADAGAWLRCKSQYHSALGRPLCASNREGLSQKNKRTGNRWRLDETNIKIKGEWKYLYRAVDKQGNTIDFLLTAKRDTKAARRFLDKAIGSSGKPSLINIDKSGANTAAIKQYNNDENRRVKIRQCKYLNNVVEQDHRFIKRIIRPMLGFKSFRSARATLAGIELWRMLKKGQSNSSQSAWEQFYALAATG
jgi:putative transposase